MMAFVAGLLIGAVAMYFVKPHVDAYIGGQ